MHSDVMLTWHATKQHGVCFRESMHLEDLNPKQEGEQRLALEQQVRLRPYRFVDCKGCAVVSDPLQHTAHIQTWANMTKHNMG